MNLVILSEFSTPSGYGVYNRHHELCRQLAADKQDYTVVVASYHHFLQKDYPKKKGFIDFVENGVRTVVINTLHYKSASSKWRLINWFLFSLRIFLHQSKIIKKGDLLIVSSPSPINVLFALFRKAFFGNRFVFEIRDIWPLTLIELGNYSRWHPLIIVLSLCEYLGYYASERIVSTLPYADDHIKSVLGKLKFNFTYIPQGYNPKMFENPEPLSGEYIEKYLSDERFTICYAGTLGLSNALEPIIEATKKLEHALPQVVFLFVGEGALRAQYRAKTRSQNNVIFAPAVKKAQVQSLLIHVDVVYDSVHDTRLYSFGLSRNKWIDYLYAGKPLLFSGPKKGITMITEERCGFIVPPADSNSLADKIKEIATISQQELAKMGERGKAYVVRERTYEALAREFSNKVL